MELIVTDLAASRAFYVDVLGLVVTEEDDTAIYLRSLEDVFRALEEAPRRRPVVIGRRS